MAEVTFTEKELGFINECTIDKKGVLVEMPANPFPSLYRKGVIAKKGDALTVTKDFRGMFCLEGQVVHIDLTKAEDEPENGGKKFKYGETGDVIIEDAPVDYADFRQAIAANLRDRRTKGIDEFQLIDKAVQVYDAAREARAATATRAPVRSIRQSAAASTGVTIWLIPCRHISASAWKSTSVRSYSPATCTWRVRLNSSSSTVQDRQPPRAQRCYDERLFAGEPLSAYMPRRPRSS